MEIDLFQEIRNKDMKGTIQSMGANKTEKAIGRASKASSGVRRIVEAFDCQLGISPSLSSRSHRSSDEDEKKICEDLRCHMVQFVLFVYVPCHMVQFVLELAMQLYT